MSSIPRIHRLVSVLSGAVLALIPVMAGAGERLIWPDQFKTDMVPVDGQTTSTLQVQNPDGIFVAQGLPTKTFWTGWAVVSLPPGTVVQSACYYTGSGAAATTACGLYKARMNASAVTIAYGVTNTASAVRVPMPITGPTVIKADGRYYVSLFAGYGAHIKGVKITY